MKRIVIIFFVSLQLLTAGYIDQVEYFIDSDPGIGDATDLSITANTDIDESFTIPMSSVSTGFHNLGLRLHDTNGKWSQTTVYPFYRVTKGANIVNLKYTIMGMSAGGMMIPGTYTPASGASIDENVTISLPSYLENGFYFLEIRAIDDAGQESMRTIHPFFKTAIPGINITAAEYFFDNDPGLGNGNAVAELTAGSDVDLIFDADLSSVSNGIHTLRIRVKDSNGNWSIGDSRTFLKESAQATNITAAEYFIDSDPGEGMATALAMTASGDIIIDDQALTTGLEKGIHHVGVRVKDSNGRWSLATVRTFLIESITADREIVACEYYMDYDPGMGAATAVSITSGSSVTKDSTLMIPATMEPGIHHIGIRTKYANGTWSLTTVRTFLVTEMQTNRQITACEYFIDQDPGKGAATPIAMTVGSSIENQLTIPIPNEIAYGIHKIGTRVQYDNGQWSLTTMRPFIKKEINNKADIASIDYYISGDGYTSENYQYTSFDQDTSIDVHITQDLGALEIGKTYDLHMKVTDDNGLESQIYNHEFLVTVDAEAPATPVDFTAVSSVGKVVLTWTANTDADLKNYHIYRGTSPTPTTLLKTIQYPTATDTLYEDTTVVSGQTYYYRMTAEDYDFNASDPTADEMVTPFWGPVWYVATDGSDETGNGSSSMPFATIQNAIDNAFEGNVVEVRAGTYMEDINFNGKNLELYSADGEDVTTIQGTGTSSVFTFVNGETNESLVEGFTITGGSTGNGGAVYCNNASNPRFSELIIQGNSGTSGGGFCIRGNSDIELENVIITNNTSSVGGGIYVYGASVELKGVVIGNHTNTQASAIYLNGSTASIKNCTIANNTTNSMGAIYCYSSTIDTIVNSIFWNNSIANIAFGTYGTDNKVGIDYSNFENALGSVLDNGNGTVNWGANNLSADPVFIDAANSDFAIRNSSPCINVGTPDTTGLDLPAVDIAGESRIFDGITDRIDMGAFEVQGEPSCTYVSGTIAENTTWGADTIKVISDITINDGVTLQINPGVYVEFQDQYEINVYGRILAEGTETDSIVFTAADVDSGWGGIRFINTPITNDSSKIAYSILQYANSGKAIELMTYSKLIVSNSVFKNNTGENGGAISCHQSSPKFYNNLFYNNKCATNTGGIYLYNSSPVIVQNIFRNNSNAAILLASSSNPVITNCVFYGNTAGESQTFGLYIQTSSSPIVKNSILYDGPNSQAYIGTDCAPTFYYNVVSGGFDSFYGPGIDGGFTGIYENNIEADPQFVDAANGDFNITAESPCINMGTPDTTGLTLPVTDYAGNPRIYDGLTDRIDIGVYEFQGEPAVSYASGTIAENTTWASDTIKVIGDITVNDGVTLIIDPGVYIEFQDLYALNVQGRLLAEGTEMDSITFTALSDEIGWKGIEFVSTPVNDSSKIAYAILEKGISDGVGSTDERGGALHMSNYSKLLVRNSLFRNNYAKYGGAVDLEYASPVFVNNRFENNDALQGGVMNMGTSSPLLNNNIFTGNTSALVIVSNSAPVIQNCVFYGNTNSTTINIEFTSNPVFRNSILWDNTQTQVFVSDNSSPEFYYCDINGGLSSFTGTGSGEDFIGVFQNNIDADPYFVDADNGDFNITAESPCINMGTPDTTGLNLPVTDYAGNPRIYDGLTDRIDIGVYEFQDEPAIAYASGTVSENTTWASDTIKVIGDITVNDGVTLTINPGVCVEFQDQFEIDVQGQLWAVGTEMDSITFTAVDTDSGWGGIKFVNPPITNDSSKIAYSVVKYSNTDEMYHAALELVNYSKVIISNSLFKHNRGVTGGAVYCSQSSPKFYSNLFYDNEASSLGGAMYLTDSSPLIVQNIFYNNQKLAIFLGGSNAEITNCVFYGNAYSISQGIGLQIDANSSPIIRNSILWDAATSQLFIQSGCAPTFEYNVVSGGFTSFYGSGVDEGFIGTYENNIDADPLFIDAAHGDFNITAESPCINMGTPDTTGLDLPTTDYVGNPRIFDGVVDRIDIGAYEFQGEPAIAYAGGSISENTTWASDTIKVISDVTVSDGVTLTIDPGVYVEFQNHYALNVDGQLLAQGTETDSITFSAPNPETGWGGIRFDNTPATNDTSRISFAVLKNGNNTSGTNVQAGALLIAATSKVVVSNSCFVNNQAESGGAVYLYSASPKFYDNMFHNNSATGAGGAIKMNSYSAPLFVRNIFWDNYAVTGGAAVGIVLSNPEFKNCIFYGQTGETVETIYITSTSNPIFTNTIIWNTATEQVLIYADCAANFNHCNIMGGLGSFFGPGSGESFIGIYENNIETDPQFVDAANGDFHLLGTSPCIDAGTPSIQDPDQTISDIGVYYYDQSLSIDISLVDHSEKNGDVTINFEISDYTQNVGLDCYYKIGDKGDWTSASITGDTSQIEPGNFSGSLTWNSKDDIYVYDGNDIWFKIDPYAYGPVVTNSDSVVMWLDNNQAQTVALLYHSVLSEYSDTVAIDYSVSDFSNDTISLSFFYQVADGELMTASVDDNPAEIYSSAYSGTVHWATKNNLPNMDYDSVRVIAIPNDGWGDGIADTTGFIHLDNNETPALDIVDLTGEVSEDVSVNYQLSDNENDSLSIIVKYALGPNYSTWNTATTTGSLTGIQSADYIGSIVWNSETDLPGQDINEVKVKIQVCDKDSGDVDESTVFHLDNNAAPVIALTEYTSEQKENIPVEFTITDAENDSCDVSIFYKESDGGTWNTATITGDLTDLRNGAYQVTWNSATDLANFAGNASLKAIANDNDAGIADSTELVVDQLGVPSMISLIMDNLTEHSGNISFNYIVEDSEYDTLMMNVEYSVDKGASWNLASIIGDLSQIDSSRYDSVFVWPSAVDLAGRDIDSVLLRVEPVDENAGVKATTDWFHVDNNNIPTIQSEMIYTEVSDSVKISFVISDSENDNITVSGFYSIDSMQTWEQATLEDDNVYSQGEYDGDIDWISHADLPGADLDSVWFKLVSSDIDTGGMDTLLFHVDNNVTPVIVLTPIASECSDTVRLEYSVGDYENDDILVYPLYSSDGGDTWDTLTYVVSPGVNSDAPIAVTGGDYSLDWLSVIDVPDDDRIIHIKFEAWDNDMNVSAVISPKVDNYHSQVLNIADMVNEQSGDVDIVFTVLASFDTVDIIPQYSFNGGTDWLAATVTGQVDNLPERTDNRIITWQSETDIPSGDIDNLMFRILSHDGWAFGGADTVYFHLDNNAPPVVTLSPMTGEYSGNISIDFDVTDDESDVFEIVPLFSVNGGSTWDTLTYQINSKSVAKSVKPSVGEVETIKTSRKSLTVTKGAMSLVWMSETDYADQQGYVRIKIEAWDNDMGTSSIISPFVDNAHNVSITLNEITTEQTDNITINYQITDATHDTIDIVPEYSLNEGASWNVASVTGLVENITSYSGNISWQSKSDAPGVDLQDTRFRLRTSDGWAEGGSDDVSFHLDNNDPPTVTLSVEEVEFHGDLTASFNWNDAEDDAITWILRYSVDGANYLKPTLEDSNINVTSKLVTFRWNTAADIPSSEIENIYLRAVASDADPGEPNLVGGIHIDNDQGTVTLTELSDEQTGDIVIPFEINESGGDPISLAIDYQLPGESGWTSAVLDTQYTEIIPAHYTGRITWKSNENLPNTDVENVLFRTTPIDNWGHGNSDTISLHIDNEMGPVVETVFPTELGTHPALWNQPITILFDKPIEASTLTANSINVTGKHTGDISFVISQDSARSVTLKPNIWYGSADTLTVTLTTDIRDIDNIPLDGNKNGDRETDGSDNFGYQFETTLLADYNVDYLVNMDDFFTFRDGWNSDPKDTDLELGPVTGTAPYFQVLRDQKLDFNDLMVLVRMWNYSWAENSNKKLISGLAKSNLMGDESVELITNYERIGKWNATDINELALEIRVDTDDILKGCEIEIQYNPEELTMTSIEPVTFSDNYKDNFLVIKNHNKANGLIGLCVAELSPSALSLEKYQYLGKVLFEPKVKRDVEVCYNVKEMIARDESADFEKQEYTRSYTFDTEPDIPTVFALHQNFPNPFNPTTTIRYELPKQCRVRMLVFNLKGELVTELVNNEKPAGYYQLRWNGKNASGQNVSSGVYLLSIQAATYHKTIKMMIMK